jgi:hypothetical protein
MVGSLGSASPALAQGTSGTDANPATSRVEFYVTVSRWVVDAKAVLIMTEEILR